MSGREIGTVSFWILVVVVLFGCADLAGPPLSYGFLFLVMLALVVCTLERVKERGR